VTVRPELAGDYEAIARVVEAAFGRAEEARLVERIRASEQNVPELSLVAEEDGAIVGHVMFSYVTLIGDGEEWQVLQLSPLAVTPERQNDGIGGALVRAGLELCDARGEPLVALLGHPSYYPRFGFEPAERHGIEPPDGRQRPAFMIARLSSYDERLRGRIVFSPAFDET
jgi:putative acetyltransferase